MFSGIQRELKYLLTHRWDLCMVTIVPVFLIYMFSSMFSLGIPKNLPIAMLDQDHSNFSQKIENYIRLNETLEIKVISPNQVDVEKLLNQNKVWGYIHIPEGAEQRLIKGQDAEINMTYNQSYYSLGNTISSAMLTSTLQATADYLGTEYLENDIPILNIPTPNIKLSVLFNPNFNYEFYLEPYVIPALLHLLLSCCVAFSVGQELKNCTVSQWLNNRSLLNAIISKNIVYIAIFSFWTWLWMIWLAGVKGWFIASHLWVILVGQFFFYAAYALVATCLVLALKESLKAFGFLAVYGGSSLSFAGVTLPLSNAPLFTKFWSDFIPYTHYAKLQTQQWVIGSPILSSLKPFSILVFFTIVFLLLSVFFLKRYVKGAQI